MLTAYVVKIIPIDQERDEPNAVATLRWRSTAEIQPLRAGRRMLARAATLRTMDQLDHVHPTDLRNSDSYVYI